MKHYYAFAWLLAALLLHFSQTSLAQTGPLDGYKICLDPGHGGHDSNDRETDLGVGTLYYESDANWEAVGYLDSLLQTLGAQTKITRLTNDPDAPDRDPSLADRVQVANTFGADYFHSFHTNGVANPDVNYSLVLYAGPEDGTADSPEALEMAEIMDDELHAVMRTTATYARADIPFTGYTNGLGVLNNLNMPGTLSEASFHSNLNEGRRLMNSKYRKNASWSIVKSFLKLYEKDPMSTGEIGGVVTDTDGNALNTIEITLNPGTAQEKVYNGDEFLNGYFMFDRLAPGEYELKFDKFGYDAQVKSVTVEAGLYTEVDASLTEAGGAPSVPVLTSIGNPADGTGVTATWVQNPETTLLGYRLYYATDDTQENWALAADENSLTSVTTSISIESSENFKVPPSGEVHHFKLTAVADNGAESERGDIYSRSSGVTGDKILIIDGFDRIAGSYDSVAHNFATNYFMAIRDSRSAEVHSAANEAVIDEIIDLSTYDMLVWFLGDESTNAETFSEAEQILVSEYLENGGKLFVSGSEMAWDLDNKGNEDDRAFYNNYLKAGYVGDGAIEFTPATGKEGTDFEGLTIEFGITYVEDWPDDIAPMGEAIAILDYAVEGANGGVAYKGTFGEGSNDGGVVNISFPLETASVEDQRSMMKTVLDYLEVGDYFAIPPAQPTLLQVTYDDNILSVKWEPNTENTLAGYRLYYATDNTLAEWELVADESTLDDETTSLSLANEDFMEVPSGDAHHFMLTAVADGGYESTNSDSYSAAQSSSSIDALIIDGFDRLGSYQVPRHTFATDYFEGLMAAEDVKITTIANEVILEESFSLADFDMVFWILGDESTADETFSDTEQLLVTAYLEQGGSLFVSGSEIGWDLYAQGTESDKLFYNNYLKATYMADGGSDRSPATGVTGTDFSDLEIEFGITYTEDYPDEIDAYEGSSVILSYANEAYCGVAYTGTFGEGEDQGHVIYFSFPLETAEQDDINSVLDKVVDYFTYEESVPPTAVDDTGNTDANVAVTINVLDNDTAGDNAIDPNSVSIVATPQSGTATVNNGQVVYTPNTDFFGTDNLTYTVADTEGIVSEEATVTITVNEPEEPVTGFGDELGVEKLSLYPNPSELSTSYIELTTREAITKPLKLTLVDSKGTNLYSREVLLHAGVNIINLRTSALNAGIYHVQLVYGDERKTLRLIKK